MSPYGNHNGIFKRTLRAASIAVNVSVFDRLHLLTNNSRFLLLPGAPRNLGSRVLSLCTRRLVSDWPARFAHPLLLVEALALDCYSILRNSGLLGKVMKIRHLLELGIFLPVPLRRARWT